jgi:hypothetical protein
MTTIDDASSLTFTLRIIPLLGGVDDEVGRGGLAPWTSGRRRRTTLRNIPGRDNSKRYFYKFNISPNLAHPKTNNGISPKNLH